MSLSAAAIRLMAEKGLTAADIADIAEAMDAGGARSPAAERQRRYRQRKAESVTRDVTRDVTPPSPETKSSPTPPIKTQPLTPSKNPPKGGQKGSRRCPTAWWPSQATLTVLEGEGYAPGDLERALTRMRDHEFRSARSDWDATFRNWVRNDADRKPRQAHDEPHHDAKFAARQANLAAAVRGADLASRERWEP